ncbi:MAG: hypothetical protein NVSMB52_15300 [Chloroflexota bacterium]
MTQINDPACPGPISVTYSWGDKTSSDTQTLSDPCGGTLYFSHLYGKDEKDTATLTITQTDHNFPSTASFDATFIEGDVLRADPQKAIKIEPKKPVKGVVAYFKNVGYPQHVVKDFTATIDWGDKTAQDKGTIKAVTGDIGDFKVSGTHTYKEPGPKDGGNWKIKVTIKDDSTIATAETPTKALEIVDADTGKLIPTETPQPEVLGEPMHLQAKMTDDSSVSNPQWSGLDDSLAISNYDVPDGGSSATLTKLTGDDRQQSTISFYFWNVQETGEKEVTVRVKEGTVSARFDLFGPTSGGGQPATTCGADVNTKATRTSLHGEPLNSPSFGLGLNDSCGNKPGIKWDFQLHAPAKSGGTIGMAQILTQNVLAHNGTDCPGSHDSGQGADLASFYDSQKHPGDAFIPVSAGGTGTWSRLESDSPYKSFPGKINDILAQKGTWYRGFSAVDYLLFKPSKAGSIWVPVGKLSWRFLAIADFEPQLPWPFWNLKLVGHPTNPPEHPAFTKGVSDPLTWSEAWGPVDSNNC